MADEEVKLHGMWGSLFSKRVEMALKLKGVPYQYIEEDLTNKSPDLLKYNPIHKKVPVLIHRRNPIIESHVILEYIDETWKTGYPLLPEDPYERSMARFWARFVDEKCLPSAWKAACSEGEEREKFTEEVHGHLKMLEEQLRGKRFFGGDAVGFLDICASFVAYWILVKQEAAGAEFLTESKFPALWRWGEEFKGCAVIKETLPDRARLLASLKAYLEIMKAPK
ncbi:hypothetical protein SAY87_028078 [Trapa incisa]|uniref:Glutathione S-transferase n=1 Tax=Trapa incisa TaxID=236973 RepID=A0AAN7QN96_9MYRT|nr:hypothetical protein SAY87_028078 [Trapa incisa]